MAITSSERFPCCRHCAHPPGFTHSMGCLVGCPGEAEEVTGMNDPESTEPQHEGDAEKAETQHDPAED